MVFLALLALVGWLGTRLLYLSLRQFGEQVSHASGEMIRERFERDFLRVWEARCADLFHPGQWMEIEGERQSGWILPTHVMIRHYTGEGSIGRTRLEEREGEWAWILTDENDPDRPPVARSSGFSGSLRLRCAVDSLQSGEKPPPMWIELLDPDNGGQWRGFAVVGRWGKPQHGNPEQ